MGGWIKRVCSIRWWFDERDDDDGIVHGKMSGLMDGSTLCPAHALATFHSPFPFLSSLPILAAQSPPPDPRQRQPRVQGPWRCISADSAQGRPGRAVSRRCIASFGSDVFQSDIVPVIRQHEGVLFRWRKENADSRRLRSGGRMCMVAGVAGGGADRLLQVAGTGAVSGARADGWMDGWTDEDAR